MPPAAPTTAPRHDARAPPAIASTGALRLQRHEPTDTVFYGIVRDHLETFIAWAGEQYARPLPAYVVAAFRAYLACGVLAKGFLRLHCSGCGHDHLVAFSCKGRGVCPSCNARRMTNTAAHMVDRVLPNVPIRQWVLSLPFELRAIAAFRPAVLTALSRTFVEAIVRFQRKKLGLPKGHGGAVTFVQRFGGSLNLNVHFHLLVLDGLFVQHGANELRFVPLPTPTREELETVARDVEARAVRWLRRKKHIREESACDDEDTDHESAAIDGCVAAALARGTLAPLGPDGKRVLDDDEKLIAAGKRKAAEVRGFNVHADVRIATDDDVGREKLLRYCARPPFALDSITVLADGRIAYRVKYARKNATHRLMTPIEFLARISALIPPPRYPLVRFHGILAPHSKLRKHVVPRPPTLAVAAPCAASAEIPLITPTSAVLEPGAASAANPTPPPIAPSAQVGAVVSPSVSPPTSELTGTSTRAEAAANATQTGNARPAWTIFSPPGARPPNELTPKHYARLKGGQLLAASRRVDWAKLLRRSFEIDVLSCPRCGSRMRFIAEITDPEVIRKILEHVGEPTSTPPVGRARGPEDYEDG